MNSNLNDSSLLEPILSQDNSFLDSKNDLSQQINKRSSSSNDISAPIPNDQHNENPALFGPPQLSNQIAQQYERRPYETLLDKSFVSNIRLIAISGATSIVAVTEDNNLWYLNGIKSEFVQFKIENNEEISCLAISSDGSVLFAGTKLGRVFLYDLKSTNLLKILKASENEITKVELFFWKETAESQKMTEVVLVQCGKTLYILKAADNTVITDAAKLGDEITKNMVEMKLFEDTYLSLVSMNSKGERKLTVLIGDITTKYIDLVPSREIKAFYFDRYGQMILVRDKTISFVDDPQKYCKIEGGDSALEKTVDISIGNQEIICEHNRVIFISGDNDFTVLMLPRTLIKDYKENIFLGYPPRFLLNLKAEGIFKFKNRRRYILKNGNQLKVVEFHHASEKKVLTNNPGLIQTCLSEDISLSAFGSKNGGIIIYNRAEIYVHIPDLHKGAINSMAFSQDNSTLVTVSSDRSIKFFNIKEKKVIKEITKAHDLDIQLLRLSKDNKIFITASDNQDFKIWDFKTYDLIYSIDQAWDPKSKITVMEVSPDKKMLVASFSDLSYKIWDLDTRILKEFPHAFYNELVYISISDDNKYMTTISNTGRIRVVDLIKYISIEEISTVESKVTAASIVPKLNLAIIVEADSIYFYNIKTKKLQFVFQDCIDEEVKAIVADPEGHYFLAVSGTDAITTFQVERPINMNNIKAHTDEIRGMSFTYDEKYMFTKSRDSSLKMWDLSTQQIVSDEKLDFHETIAVGHSHPYLAYAYDQGFVITNYETKAKIFSISTNMNSNTLSFCQHDEYLISGDWTGKLFILRLSDQHWEIIPNAHSPGQLRVLGYENYIISAGYHEIKIWERETRKSVVTFKNVHSDSISNLHIGRKKKLLVSTSGDKTIKIWSLETWQLVHEFTNAHEAVINFATFSKDENFIISAADDYSIKIWNVHMKTLLHKFEKIHKDMALCCRLTSDNKYMVSCSKSGDVKFTEINLPNVYIYLPDIDPLFLNLKAAFESNKKMIIFPQSWNILHYYAIISPKLLFTIPKDYQISFILDTYKKTPLPYLKKTDNDTYERCYNHVFIIILNFLERTIKNDFHSFQETMVSLSPHLFEIFDLVYSASLKRFLKLCYGHAKPYHGQLLDNYIGDPNPDPVILNSPTLRKDDLAQMFTKGHSKIAFKTTHMPINLDIRSEEIYRLFEFLEKEKRRYFIESEFISSIVDCMWQKSKPVEAINLVLFFILMAFLTLSVSNIDSEEQELYEIITLGLTVFWLIYKVYQIRIFGSKYFFAQRWNLIDFACLIPMAVQFSSSLIGFLNPADHLLSKWLYIVSILLGYLRMICYLRIIDQTRNLIRTISKIIVDMRSFSLIVAFILVGFCSTLMALDYQGNNFIENLYTSYFMLFAPIAGDNSISEQILSILYPFILNLVFINMLINIMGDSFDEIHEKKKYTDNKERIKLIHEACIVLRHFQGRQEEDRLNYLFNAIDEDDAEEKSVQEVVEEMDHSMHKLETKIEGLEGGIEKIFEKLEGMNELKTMMQHIEEKLNQNGNNALNIEGVVKNMIVKQYTRTASITQKSIPS